MKIRPEIRIMNSLEDINLQDLDTLSSQTNFQFLQISKPKKKEDEQPVITYYKKKDSSKCSLF